VNAATALNAARTNLTLDALSSKRLYGLRGLAILLVLAAHSDLEPFAYSFGPVAVRLFFVLSGFHITLSFWKAQSDAPQNGPLQTLRGFYLKRFMRIAPLYYGGLLAGVVLNLPEARHNFKWDSLFMTNVGIVHAGDWPTSTAHFWSLAVQEQFYLLWPLLMMLSGRKLFGWVIALSVACSLFFRFYCLSQDVSPFWYWLLLPGCWDSFMAGAVLAFIYARHREEETVPARPSFRRSWLALPFAASVVIFFWPVLAPTKFLCEALEAVSLAALVWHLLGRVSHPVARFLEGKWLVHLGRNSYPLYVFQAFLHMFLWEKMKQRFGHHFTPLAAWVTFFTVIVVCLVIVGWMQQSIKALRQRVVFV